MRSYIPLILTHVAFAAITDGTYTNFKLITTEEEQCKACSTPSSLTVDKIEECLAKVPDTCSYTVDLSVPNGAALLCPQKYGMDFSELSDTITTASVAKMTASLKLALDTQETGDCTFQVFVTNDEAQRCSESTQGTEIKDGWKFSTGELTVGVEDIQGVFINMVKPTGTKCGSKLNSAEYENLAATLSLMGTMDPESTDESTTESEPSDNDPSGATPLLVPTVFTLLASLYAA